LIKYEVKVKDGYYYFDSRQEAIKFAADNDVVIICKIQEEGKQRNYHYFKT